MKMIFMFSFQLRNYQKFFLRKVFAKQICNLENQETQMKNYSSVCYTYD